MLLQSRLIATVSAHSLMSAAVVLAVAIVIAPFLVKVSGDEAAVGVGGDLG